MFQLKEGIQTECQGPSQALEIKREVWSNGQDDSHMLQDESCSSYGHSFLLRSLFFKIGGLLSPPIYHSSNGQVMGLG